MVRFNDDLNTLEFYNGIEWRQFTVSGASGRGITGGGFSRLSLGNIPTSRIESFSLVSDGNSLSFGDLTASRYTVSAVASSTRGVFGGGLNPSVSPTFNTDVIDYITIASKGNAISFGSHFENRATYGGGMSSSTRGVFAGAYKYPGGQTSTIDYIEISTLGNALDFGDVSTPRWNTSSCSSPTRGVHIGGYTPISPNSGSTNIIDFIIFSSKGNTIDFGSLTQKIHSVSSCSNSIRGITMGGTLLGGSHTNNISFITIASNGNSTDFGSLTEAKINGSTASSNTRGYFAGGRFSPAVGRYTIEYVSIQSGGNAIDFGDLSIDSELNQGCSDSHGGLGGF